MACIDPAMLLMLLGIHRGTHQDTVCSSESNTTLQHHWQSRVCVSEGNGAGYM